MHRWLENALRGAIEGVHVLAGQYVAYDMSCIIATFPDLEELVWETYRVGGVLCTSIREKLLDIAIGVFPYPIDTTGTKTKSFYSLADIARVSLGMTVSKGEDTWRTRYSELANVPLGKWPQEAIEYAIRDAELVSLILENQDERALGLHYDMPTQFDDVRADFALRMMSVWGIRVNTARVSELWEDSMSRLHEIAEQLVADKVAKRTKPKDEPPPGHMPMPAIQRNMAAIRELIEQTYPGTPPQTPGGKTSTAAEVIEECSDPVLIDLVEFGKVQKVASTYLTKMFEPLIHARFDAVGGASDRTSCRDPNLQNQPNVAGIRECFIPSPGHVFVSADFDSQEMRTLAQCCLDICGKSRLAERYQADRHFDPHLEFAARLAGISVEQAARLLAEKNEDIKALRQQSKVCNFGFPGGMGVDTFVHYAKGWGVEITPDRAQELKNAWFEQWPEMYTYFRHASNLVDFEGMSGVMIHPQSRFRRGGCTYMEISNGYFQTLAAHASKSAQFEVSRRCYVEPESALYGSRPVVFVHDELILEVPEFAIHETGQELERVMIEKMEKWTPAIPSSAEAKAMRYWSKAAERVVDAEGRLTVWEETS